ncbi:MAG: hypothetical protein AB8B64_22000 [Granulosicoccus sp.]
MASDYAYVMQFDGDKVCQITKIWNDLHALRALGWASAWVHSGVVFSCTRVGW